MSATFSVVFCLGTSQSLRTLTVPESVSYHKSGKGGKPRLNSFITSRNQWNVALEIGVAAVYKHLLGPIKVSDFMFKVTSPSFDPETSISGFFVGEGSLFFSTSDATDPSTLIG